MKDGLAASHFQLLEAKLVHSINKLRYFKLHDKISVISALMSSYTFFTKLGSGFWAHRYRPPPLQPARHFHILCILGQHIYMQKLLLALGGGATLYKTFFLISIYFIVKMIV